MLVAGAPYGAFATNCYVVAPAAGAECVIIDPGEAAEPGVVGVVDEHRLTPVAVLLTHGHLDHMWSARLVSSRYGVPCWVHPADRHLLADPLAGLPADWAGALAAMGGESTAGGLPDFTEPNDVRELADGDVLTLAGLEFIVDHTPGHTGGSVTFRTAESSAEPPALLFSGDLVFAGSIGRTDLPGGDHPTMLHSLVERILPLDDAVTVLPGHGDQTTIGRERVTNPFLTELTEAPSGPTRGR